MRPKLFANVCLITCIIFTGVFASDGETAGIDKYRAILSNGSFTIKYRIINYDIPEMRRAMSLTEGVYYTPSELGYKEEDTQRLKDEEKSKREKRLDILVMDGNNRYTEMGGNCKLIINGEVFSFFHEYYKEGKYIGCHVGKHGFIHRNEVAPGEKYGNGWSRQVYRNQEEIQDIENPVFVKMLAAIYPISKVNVVLPEYSYVTSGATSDGYTYEDYSGVADGRLHAVRCYFQGVDLIKMAYASFLQNSSAPKDSYEKVVIQFETFNNIPEQQYFSVPADLKIVR